VRERRRHRQRQLQLETLEARRVMAQVTVTTADDTNDAGIQAGSLYTIDWLLKNPGLDTRISLREAIIAANNTAGADTIAFNIGSSGSIGTMPVIGVGGTMLGTTGGTMLGTTGGTTILVGSTGLGALPAITGPLTIDGYTQPGASRNTLASGSNAAIVVEISGARLMVAGGNGLSLQGNSAGSVIRGLAVTGFAGAGIVLNGSKSTVAGNFIGLVASGQATSANGVGVLVTSQGNTIGGINPQDRNQIGGNTITGVQIVGSTSQGNRVQRNEMFQNAKLGIDLVVSGDPASGITANDGLKTANSPNLRMDRPVLTAVTLAAGQLNLRGYVGSAANQAAFAGSTVEVFVAEGSAANAGGRRYLGLLTADAAGNFSRVLSDPLSMLTVGQWITATATDTSGNTSEFAAVVAIQAGDVLSVQPDAATAEEAGGVNNGVGGKNGVGNVLANDSGAGNSVIGVVAGQAASASGNVGLAVAGAYGSLRVESTGGFTYVVNNAHPAIQALAPKQTLQDTFTYTARNSAGQTGTTQVRITITGANDAPTLTPITNRSTAEDVPTAPIAFTLTDPDTPQAGLTLSAVSSDPALVGPNGFTFAGDTQSRTLVVRPNADAHGKATITVTTGDGGYSTVSSFVLTVTPVNDAPVLTTGEYSLTPLGDATTDPPGNTVAEILASRGGTPITDPDAGALQGVAVWASTATAGQWQYRLEGQSTWSAVGTISSTAALLLRSGDRLRFLPTPNASVPSFGTISIHAWDQSDGLAAGTKANVGTRGGATAFSAASATATILAAGNDTLATAMPLTLYPGLPAVLGQHLGDGPNAARDVDLFRVSLVAGQVLNLAVAAQQSEFPADRSALRGRMRLFNAAGVELATSAATDAADPTLLFTAPANGDYFIGVSSRENAAYDPGSLTGRPVNATTGGYLLHALTPLAAPAAFDRTITVTSGTDGWNGMAGSLRAAIDAANAAGGRTLVVVDQAVAGIVASSVGFEIRGDITIRGRSSGSKTEIAPDAVSGPATLFQVQPGGTLRLENVNLRGRSSTVGAASLVRVAGSLVLDRVEIAGGSGDLGGGIHVAADGRAQLINSTVADSRAAEGGAVYVAQRGLLTAINSTFGGNDATRGGAAISNRGTVSLFSSTIARNGATGSTAAAAIASEAGSRFVLLNTIVADNALAADTAGAFVSHGTNLVGNAAAATGLQPSGILRDLVGGQQTAPVMIGIVGPLTTNGGPTRTMLPLATSWAIDAGRSFGRQSADQRGAERMLDGPDRSRPLDVQGQVDIGAVEFGTYFVNDPRDLLETASSPLDGLVDADPLLGGAQVSLRAAVRELVAIAGWTGNPATSAAVSFEGVVRFESGLGDIALSRQGAAEDASLTGDLDIWGNLRVVGNAGATRITGTSQQSAGPGVPPRSIAIGDRAFHVHSGARLSLEGLTLADFTLADAGTSGSIGGTILNDGGTVRLVSSQLTRTIPSGSFEGSALAATSGGGIYTRNGSVEIVGSTLTKGLAVAGGAIYVESGTLSVDGRSSILGNQAQRTGGGIHVQGGQALITGGTALTQNLALESGGHVFVDRAGVLTARDGARLDGNGNQAARAAVGLAVSNFGRLDLGAGVTVAGHSLYGGSLIFNDGVALLDGVTIASNTRTAKSSLVHNRPAGRFEMRGVTVSGNAGSDPGPGAVLNEDGWMRIDASRFTDNANPDTEAGLIANVGIDADLAISASRFEGNRVSAEGGAPVLFNRSGNVVVDATTFDRNFNTAGFYATSTAVRNLGLNERIENVPASLVRLVAAVGAGQKVLLVDDLSPLENLPLPFHMLLGSERITVTALDWLHDALRVERTEARGHAVDSELRPFVDSTQQYLVVGDPAAFARYTLPFDIAVHDEVMTVTAIQGNLLTVERGRNGTRAAEHAYPFDVWAVSGGLQLTNVVFSDNHSADAAWPGGSETVFNWVHPYAPATVLENVTFFNNSRFPAEIYDPLRLPDGTTAKIFQNSADVQTFRGPSTVLPEFQRTVYPAGHKEYEATWSDVGPSMVIRNSVFSSQPIGQGRQPPAVRGLFRSGGGNFVDAALVVRGLTRHELSATDTVVRINTPEVQLPALPFLAQFGKVVGGVWRTESVLVTAAERLLETGETRLTIVRGVAGTVADVQAAGTVLAWSANGFWAESDRFGMSAFETFRDAATTLPAAITAEQTLVAVADPTDLPRAPFNARLLAPPVPGREQDPRVVEDVTVTQVAGSVLTVVRGLAGTARQPFAAGSTFSFSHSIDTRIDPRLIRHTPVGSSTSVIMPAPGSPLIDSGLPSAFTGPTVAIDSALGTTYGMTAEVLFAVGAAGSGTTATATRLFPEDTLFAVADAAALPAAPFVMQVGDELMEVRAVDVSRRAVTVVRGAYGTVAGSWPTGTAVRFGTAVSAADTRFLVTDAATLPAAPFFLVHGTEIVRVDAVDVATGIVRVTRGALGSTPTPHAVAANFRGGFEDVGNLALNFETLGRVDVQIVPVSATTRVTDATSATATTLYFESLPLPLSGVVGGTIMVNGETMFVTGGSRPDPNASGRGFFLSVIRGYAGTEARAIAANAPAGIAGFAVTVPGEFAGASAMEFLRVGDLSWPVKTGASLRTVAGSGLQAGNPADAGRAVVAIDDERFRQLYGGRNAGIDFSAAARARTILPAQFGRAITADTAAQIQVNVSDAFNLPAVPFLVRFGNERMVVTAVDEATNTLTVRRGADGTARQPHALGARPDQGTFVTVAAAASLPAKLPAEAWIGTERVLVTGVDAAHRLLTVSRALRDGLPLQQRPGESLVFGQHRFADGQRIVSRGVINGSLDRGATEAVIFDVDTFADLPDLVPGDGLVTTAAGTRSLRAAIMEANALAGFAVIRLPAGTYRLGAELAIGSRVEIIGESALTTKIAADTSRAIRVASGGALRLAGVSVSGRSAGAGGAVLAEAATVVIDRGLLADSTATAGAAVAGINADVTIRNSTLSGNVATGAGGALHAQGGRFTLEAVTVSGNRADGEGGAYRGDAASVLVVSSSTISRNTAAVSGGIVTASVGNTIGNSIVAGNTATGGATAPDILGVVGSLGSNLIGVVSGASWTPTDRVGTAGRPLDAGLAPLAAAAPGTLPVHALLPGSPAIDGGDGLQWSRLPRVKASAAGPFLLQFERVEALPPTPFMVTTGTEIRTVLELDGNRGLLNEPFTALPPAVELVVLADSRGAPRGYVSRGGVPVAVDLTSGNVSAGTALRLNGIDIGAVEAVPSLALSVDRVVATETAGGVTAFTFTITRSGPAGEPLRSDFVVERAGDNPVSADDFVGGVWPRGSVVFAAGETVKTVSIAIADDSVVEAAEQFAFRLVSPMHALVPVRRLVATVAPDGDRATFTVSAPATVAEGRALRYDVTLRGQVQGGVWLAHAFAAGTGSEADLATIAGLAERSGVLRFDGRDGETKSFVGLTAQDTAAEGNETFTRSFRVLGSGLTGLIDVPAAVATTIVDDDQATPPDARLVVTPGEARETDGMMTFQVRLEGSLPAPVRVRVSTVPLSASAAADFVPTTAEFVFSGAAGQSHAFQVPIVDRLGLQADRLFEVVAQPLDAAAGRVQAGSSAGAIRDVDNPLTAPNPNPCRLAPVGSSPRNPVSAESGVLYGGLRQPTITHTTVLHLWQGAPIFNGFQWINAVSDYWTETFVRVQANQFEVRGQVPSRQRCPGIEPDEEATPSVQDAVAPTIDSVWVVPQTETLVFNPFAGHDYRVGDKPRLVIGDGTATTQRLTYGTLTVNPDNTLTYVPFRGAESGPLLPELDIHGNIIRFAGRETFTVHLVNERDGEQNPYGLPREVASQIVELTVANNLPVLIGTRSHDLGADLKMVLPGDIFVDAQENVGPTAAPAERSVRLDIRDIFADDGDEVGKLRIWDVVYRDERLNNSRPASDLFPGFDDPYKDDIRVTVGENLRAPATSPLRKRQMVVTRVDQYTLDIYNPARLSDIQAGPTAWSSEGGTEFTFQVLVTDGSKKLVTKVENGVETLVEELHTWPLEVTIRPNTTHVTNSLWRQVGGTPAQETRPWIKTVDSQFTDTVLGSPAADQFKNYRLTTFTSADVRGGNLQSFGAAAVDLFTGDALVRQPLILDLSGGKAEATVPGLIYDSSTVHDSAAPRQVIYAVVEHAAGALAPASIAATLRWIDDRAGVYDTAPTVTITPLPARPGVAPNTRHLVAVSPRVTPAESGLYSWRLDLDVAVPATADRPAETLRYQTFGELPVIVGDTVEIGSPEDPPLLRDRQANPFGAGWMLEGVPNLFYDKRGTLDPQDDRILIQFPGAGVKVFDACPVTVYQGGYTVELPSMAVGASGYGIDERDFQRDSREYGRLTFDGGRYTYTAADGRQFHFRTMILPDAAGVASKNREAVVIDRIELPGNDFDATTTGRRGISFNWRVVPGVAGVSQSRPLLDTMTASDRSVTTFVYDAGHKLERIEVGAPGRGRVYDIGMREVRRLDDRMDRTLLERVTELNRLAKPVDGLTAPVAVNVYAYDGGMLREAKLVAGDQTSRVVAQTTIKRDAATKMVSQVQVGDLTPWDVQPSGRAGRGTLVRAADLQATVRQEISDLEKYDPATRRGAAAGGVAETRRTFDARGRMTGVSERFNDQLLGETLFVYNPQALPVPSTATPSSSTTTSSRPPTAPRATTARTRPTRGRCTIPATTGATSSAGSRPRATSSWSTRPTTRPAPPWAQRSARSATRRSRAPARGRARRRRSRRWPATKSSSWRRSSPGTSSASRRSPKPSGPAPRPSTSVGISMIRVCSRNRPTSTAW
jgi:VCBS repeat-containing protein